MANSIWIDTSPASQVQQVGPVADNTAAPPFTFTNDATTGFGSSASGSADLVTSGVSRAKVNSAGFTVTVPVLASNGAVAAPSLSFINDATTGRYRIGSNNPGEAVNGAIVFDWNATRVNLANAIALALNGDSGTSGKVIVGGTSPAYTASPSLTALTLSGALSAATAVLSGKSTTYNGTATAGIGLVPVYAAGRTVGAVNATVGSISTFTVGASDASVFVSANVNVTAVTAAAMGVTCTYTDETNTSRTLTLAFTQLTGATLLTSITNVTGTGPYEGFPFHIRCKAATTITFATTGTVTGITYNVEGIVLQVA